MNLNIPTQHLDKKKKLNQCLVKHAEQLNGRESATATLLSHCPLTFGFDKFPLATDEWANVQQRQALAELKIKYQPSFIRALRSLQAGRLRSSPYFLSRTKVNLLLFRLFT